MDNFKTIRFTFLFALIASSAHAQQSPYKGEPFKIPGIIEAEDYDRGGEGVAYHDADLANQGNAYRTREGVDIEPSREHEYNIGWTQADEWVEYSIQVMSSGVYRADLRFAAASDRSYFHLEIDRANLSGTVEIPVTGGWQTWTTVTLPYVYLSEGRKILRFHAESAGFNINYMNFTLVESTQLPQVKLTAPQDDEHFQLGEPITLSADAADPDGFIRQVEFYANSKKIGQAVSAPFTITWTPDKIDHYELYARAVDNVGAFALSDTLTIGIKFPSFDDGPFFSAEHGFYTTPFDLQIDGGFSGVVIHYTLDGSDPVNSKNALRANSPVQIRVDPAGTTNRGNTPAFVVRAVTMAGTVQKSRVRTQTYIFPGRVRAQKRPANWPESGINGQNLRYDISSEVVNDAQYKSLIEPALKDIPTLSMATDMAHLFDPQTGIYVNALEDGIDWERPASLELIYADGTAGFQVDAGVRIRGGWSRNAYFPKHAFRLFFREQYGFAKLKYPLFGDEGGEEFDKMDLRCSQNYSWHSEGSPLNTENRDVFSRDLQREMGQPYTRSRYYHLYINGMYWGLYETQERSEAAYAATYLGGDPEDYDVIKVDAGPGRPYTIEATDGNLDGWREVWNACQRGFASNEEYFKLEGRLADGSSDPLVKPLVDIDNLIDYMLVIFHAGNYDSPVSKFGSNKSPNNFYAINNRKNPKGFVFFAHDNEHTLLIDNINVGSGIDENRVNIGTINGNLRMEVGEFGKFHPQWLHHKLTENAEYRMRFADHIYHHYFNNGIFQPQRASALFMERADMISLAIIAESARWGNLYLSKNRSWLPTVTEIAQVYLYDRYDIVLDQYQKAGLYPKIAPPIFKAEGRELLDESLSIASSLILELVNSNNGDGSAYYTLNGSDPREVGGALSPSAIDAGDQTQITISSTAIVNARVKSGNVWSALHTLRLTTSDGLPTLKITEIHYKPLEGESVSGSEYEFLEFKNIGKSPLDLSLATFSNGVQFTFPIGISVENGRFVVLASNAAAFKERYGFTAMGEFEGQLDNAGERIVLLSAAGDTVVNVRYNDKAPWPEEPDQSGHSLAAAEVNPVGDANDPLYWVSSFTVHGSPGHDDKIAAPVERTRSPGSFSLAQNFPNPFNNGTRIEFSLPVQCRVTIVLFDILGREIERLIDDEFASGRHYKYWDGTRFPAGVYIYRLETSAGFRQSKKMLLIK